MASQGTCFLEQIYAVPEYHMSSIRSKMYKHTPSSYLMCIKVSVLWPCILTDTLRPVNSRVSGVLLAKKKKKSHIFWTASYSENMTHLDFNVFIESVRVSLFSFLLHIIRPSFRPRKCQTTLTPFWLPLMEVVLGECAKCGIGRGGLWYILRKL